MALRALSTPQFIRKTELRETEYRKNFHQIDDDVIEAITSPAADAVTTLMSKIYLRLYNAPRQYWERPGVLHFKGEYHGDEWVNAWKILYGQAHVASATAHKALDWMHEQGVIGYHARKNGVGIRIFFNRAANSIGTRTPSPSAPASMPKPASTTAAPVPETGAEQKILAFRRASPDETPASSHEAPFKVISLDITLDTNIDSDAPCDLNTPSAPSDSAHAGDIQPTTTTADETAAKPAQEAEATNHTPAQEVATPETSNTPNQPVVVTVTTPDQPTTTPVAPTAPTLSAQEVAQGVVMALLPVLKQFAAQPVQVIGNPVTPAPVTVSSKDVAHGVILALIPTMKEVAAQTAREAVKREAEQTRRWFEERALPKAVRVAQHESYNVLRKYGVLAERDAQTKAGMAVGGQPNDEPPTPAETTPPPPCTPEQLAEIADTCVTLQQFHGTPLDTLLENFCVEQGGPLHRSQMPQVKNLVDRLQNPEQPHETVPTTDPHQEPTPTPAEAVSPPPAPAEIVPLTAPCSPEQLTELAQACVALWQLQGAPVDATMENFCAEYGGPLHRSQMPQLKTLVEQLQNSEQLFATSPATDPLHEEPAPTPAEAASLPRPLPPPCTCTPEELEFVAEMCADLCQKRGYTISAALAKFSVENGGPLHGRQLAQVRALVCNLLNYED